MAPVGLTKSLHHKPKMHVYCWRALILFYYSVAIAPIASHILLLNLCYVKVTALQMMDNISFKPIRLQVLVKILWLSNPWESTIISSLYSIPWEGQKKQKKKTTNELNWQIKVNRSQIMYRNSYNRELHDNHTTKPKSLSDYRPKALHCK